MCFKLPFGLEQTQWALQAARDQETRKRERVGKETPRARKQDLAPNHKFLRALNSGHGYQLRLMSKAVLAFCMSVRLVSSVYAKGRRGFRSRCWSCRNISFLKSPGEARGKAPVCMSFHGFPRVPKGFEEISGKSPLFSSASCMNFQGSTSMASHLFS